MVQTFMFPSGRIVYFCDPLTFLLGQHQVSNLSTVVLHKIDDIFMFGAYYHIHVLCCRHVY